MTFSLVDRIKEVLPGESLTAVKSLSLAEEYLRDHFPLLPVMPGVMMLESMYQVSAWLTRVTHGFTASMVLMKEARAVKFSGFVQPGETLTIRTRLQKEIDEDSWFKCEGSVEGRVVVSARLVLRSFNLADTNPADAITDEQIRQSMKKQFQILYPPSPDAA